MTEAQLSNRNANRHKYMIFFIAEMVEKNVSGGNWLWQEHKWFMWILSATLHALGSAACHRRDARIAMNGHELFANIMFATLIGFDRNTNGSCGYCLRRNVNGRE